MRIGELAAQSGLSIATLRYYERERLMPAPPRRAGKRDYAPADLARARLIKAARAAGIPIADLRALFAVQDRAQLDALLRQRLDQTEAALARIARQRAWLQAAAACGCVAPSRCTLIDAFTRQT